MIIFFYTKIELTPDFALEMVSCRCCFLSAACLARNSQFVLMTSARVSNGVSCPVPTYCFPADDTVISNCWCSARSEPSCWKSDKIMNFGISKSNPLVHSEYIHINYYMYTQKDNVLLKFLTSCTLWLSSLNLAPGSPFFGDNDIFLVCSIHC